MNAIKTAFIFVCMIFMLQSFSIYKYELLNQLAQPCDSIPELNRQIVAFAEKNIKKKVGTGECWDLAAEALNQTAAQWNGEYVYGKPVNPETDCVYPGDIIQFEGVVIKYTKDNMRYTESMPHHTAIVYKVNGKGDYQIAHQNYGNGIRTVGLTFLNLKNITQGELIIYRPTE